MKSFGLNSCNDIFKIFFEVMCVIEGLDWKCFRKGFVVFTVIFGLIITTGLLLKYEQSKNVPTVCKDSLSCPTNWHCCDMGCCAPAVTASPRTEHDKETVHDSWYMQWPVLFFLGLLGGIVICCVWFLCRRNHSCGGFSMSCFCCAPSQRDTEVDSAGSLYPPPRYSRCGSFPQAPPPYSEVQSKPDLYPLVITCAEGDAKHGNGGSYLMVHYFRNCVIRPPPGSLSATSTAESLNSSFICNAANEANSIIPPPYSCANNFEEYGCRRPMLRSMSSLTDPRPARLRSPSSRAPGDDMDSTTPYMDPDGIYELCQGPYPGRAILGDMYREGVWRMASSPTSNCSPTHRAHTENIFEPEAYEMRHVTQPPPESSSPTQLTSPTQEPSRSKDPRRPPEDRRQRRLDSIKRNIKKSSFYMPLSPAYPARPTRISSGARASSRSAPATPCSNLVPNLLNFTHRASRFSSRSSRLEEEYDALIFDSEQTHTDHNF